DPDPLYVAALHDVCEATAPKLRIATLGTNLAVMWPAPTCYSLQSATNLVATNTIWGNAVESVIATDDGQMMAIVTITNNYRYYRLYK
ncbi:MAG: hypothetical protein JWM68_1650, partial [Verrucomicrobiales bacterium]|nr:hypothetical protein [Verrucomicrobiales bacterium]